MNQLRPDWPVKSLRTLLSKPELASRARRDVTVALAWVACETATATPARVLENGPWWKAAGATGSVTRRHPTPLTACQNCGHEWALDCCERPIRRGDRTHAPAADIEAQAAAARRLLHPPADHEESA